MESAVRLIETGCRCPGEATYHLPPGTWEKQKTLLEEALLNEKEISQYQVRITLEMAATLFLNQNYQQAEHAYELAIKASSSKRFHKAAWIGLIQTLTASKQQQKARSAVKRALAYAPEDAMLQKLESQLLAAKKE